jgi:hypothetical protein
VKKMGATAGVVFLIYLIDIHMEKEALMPLAELNKAVT